MDEEIKKIIDNLEERIILHSIIKEPISSDLDKAIKLSVAYEELLEENLKLKEQYCERTDCSGRLGTSKKVEELQQENQELKEQQKGFIKYLESKINMIKLNSNTTTLRAYSKKIIPYIEILSKYKEMIGSDK